MDGEGREEEERGAEGQTYKVRLCEGPRTKGGGRGKDKRRQAKQKSEVGKTGEKGEKARGL